MDTKGGDMRFLIACVLTLALTASSAGRTVTWLGATSSEWFDSSNWDPGLPEAGDAVLIGASAKVSLSSSTPVLSSVVLAEGTAAKPTTLTFSNWDTALRAATVAVSNNAILTCAGPFKDTEMSNRVYVVATESVTICAGGKIDVDAKGWGASGSDVDYGCGRGCWKYGGIAGGGGSYGGHGGHMSYAVALTYGSAEWPTDPGSSAHQKEKGTTTGTLAPGGGAVYVDAKTASVTVDGLVTACGKNADSYKFLGGGSGGSILIDCKTLSGATGSLMADGGAGSGNSKQSPGGGGRIALHYDAAVQTADMAEGLVVTAKAGSVWKGFAASAGYYPVASLDEDVRGGGADMGTVWVSDAKLLAGLGKGLSGCICGNIGSKLTVDDLEFGVGQVRFQDPGFELEIVGSLSVTGAQTRLEIGGGAFRPIYSSSHLETAGGDPFKLTVGRNLSVAEGGRVDIRSAAVAKGRERIDAGAVVSVGGTLSIATNSAVFAWSCPTNHGSAVFQVKDLIVANGGRLSATARGFAGRTTASSADYPVTVLKQGQSYGMGGGPGYSNAEGAGAGHAGKGANARYWQGVNCGAITETDKYRPALAGSSSGGTSIGTGDTPGGGSGGGVIHVVASGTVTCDGEISANGGFGSAQSANLNPGGAGGTVLIDCKKFGGAATGVLSARGGYSSPKTNYGYGGGGGFVTVWTGAPYVADARVSKYHRDLPQPATFLGTATATHGESWNSAKTVERSDLTTYGLAGDGFVTWCHLDGPRGMAIILR